MTNKSNTLFKTKLIRKSIANKSSTSVISSSVYSGVASAQRAIQNPGPLLAVHMNPIKQSNEYTANLITEAPLPVEYHAWTAKYHQIYTRENNRKSMTKESYAQKSQVIMQAKESLTTEEECELELIPAEAIQIKQPIIHGEDKIPSPNIIRYVRNNDVISSSERILPLITAKKSSLTQLGAKTPFPMIGTNQNIPPAATITTRNVILSQIKLRHNTADVQRSARRSKMETIHETITPLTVYG